MSISPNQQNILTPNSTARRPTSFLGANLESSEMDPDLMMSMADMGYFHSPIWTNTSTTAVRDYEFESHGAGPYGDDDEAERLLRRRSTVEEAEAREAEWESNLSVWRDGAVERAVAPPTRMKRRWSTRLSEGFAGFGRAVKKRADSWSWRKDSVATAPAAPVVHEGVRANVRSISSVSSAGSGERSRDGGDEFSGEDELFNYTMGRRRHTTQAGGSGMTRLPWAGNHPGRRRATQTAPMREEEPAGRVRFHHARAALAQQPEPVDELQRFREAEERFQRSSS